MNVACIVLASGNSTRFENTKSKLFYNVYGAPILEFTLKNIVKYIIAVSTTVEVTLLALSWSTNQNMIIQPTRYSIQTEGKIMTHLIGSRSGRIFILTSYLLYLVVLVLQFIVLSTLQASH